jgi:hypothetical protein
VLEPARAAVVVAPREEVSFWTSNVHTGEVVRATYGTASDVVPRHVTVGQHHKPGRTPIAAGARVANARQCTGLADGRAIPRLEVARAAFVVGPRPGLAEPLGRAAIPAATVIRFSR